MRFFIPIFIMSFSFLLPTAGTPDSEPTTFDLDSKAVQVSMFKNGIGLVRAQVQLPKDSGILHIRPLPNAQLGSVWFQWPKNVGLTDIKATQAQTKKIVAAQNIAEVLEANIKRGVLDLKIREQWQRAEIIDIPKRHDSPIIPMQPKNIIPPPKPPERGELLILKNNMGTQAIPISWVQEIRFPDDDPFYTIVRHTQENQIECHYTASNQDRSSDSNPILIISYLAKGIAWSPSYTIDITKDKKALLFAKAVIVNDLVALENSHTELIAGFPHIEHENIPSAFSLTNLQQLLDQIRGQRGRERPERDMLSQRMMLSNTAMAYEPSMPDIPVSGESTEDLYFYQLPNVTLKKGERGYYPLFSSEIPYEHLYTWDIPDTVDAGSRYRQERLEEQQVVWHSLKLTNTTEYPWTTAPAMTTKDNRILGQDTIQYTPPQASSELKITQALSIKAEQKENEIERRRNAATFYHDSFDLVKVQGELALSNFKKEPVTVKITKTVSGEVLETDSDPNINKLATGLRLVNPRSELTWNIQVKPGKDNAVKLTYIYEVYVRN